MKSSYIIDYSIWADDGHHFRSMPGFWLRQNWSSRFKYFAWDNWRSWNRVYLLIKNQLVNIAHVEGFAGIWDAPGNGHIRPNEQIIKTLRFLYRRWRDRINVHQYIESEGNEQAAGNRGLCRTRTFYRKAWTCETPKDFRADGYTRLQQCTVLTRRCLVFTRQKVSCEGISHWLACMVRRQCRLRLCEGHRAMKQKSADATAE